MTEASEYVHQNRELERTLAGRRTELVASWMVGNMPRYRELVRQNCRLLGVPRPSDADWNAEMQTRLAKTVSRRSSSNDVASRSVLRLEDP